MHHPGGIMKRILTAAPGAALPPPPPILCPRSWGEFGSASELFFNSAALNFREKNRRVIPHGGTTLMRYLPK
jgi:hypothetical protein